MKYRKSLRLDQPVEFQGVDHLILMFSNLSASTLAPGLPRSSCTISWRAGPYRSFGL